MFPKSVCRGSAYVVLRSSLLQTHSSTHVFGSPGWNGKVLHTAESFFIMCRLRPAASLKHFQRLRSCVPARADRCTRGQRKRANLSPMREQKEDRCEDAQAAATRPRRIRQKMERILLLYRQHARGELWEKEERITRWTQTPDVNTIGRAKTGGPRDGPESRSTDA